ncbi:MFS transporter [Streptomyces griseoluteus]|uniref:MFS transporter n=1 Tax=Streptomyces griseoluteus TaxID=29306 RepID=UPI00380F0E13
MPEDRNPGESGRTASGMLRRVTGRAGGFLLPDSRAGRTLVIGSFVDALGTGMFMSSATLYFVGVVGIAADRIAWASTLAGALALLAPVPLGRLADRFGPGRFYMVLLVLRGLGYACYAFTTQFAPYLVLTMALTALDRASTPIQQAVVTVAVDGNDGTRTMASIRAVRNIGFTVGILLAGGVFAADSRPAFTALFLGNGLSFLVIAFTVRLALSRVAGQGARPPESAAGTELGASPVPSGGVRSPFWDGWFMLFTLANGILSLYDTVLLVLLPVWVMQYTDIPSAVVPLLMVVNTVLTVGLQIVIARHVDEPATAVRFLVVSGVLLAVSCGFFALAQGTTNTVLAVAMVLVATVVLTVAENLQSVAAWELSAVLAPKAARARYLGAFSLAFTGQKVIGPSLLVIALLPAGLLAWPLLATAFGCAAAVSGTSARRALAARVGQPPAVVPSPVAETPVEQT